MLYSLRKAAGERPKMGERQKICMNVKAGSLWQGNRLRKKTKVGNRSKNDTERDSYKRSEKEEHKSKEGGQA